MEIMHNGWIAEVSEERGNGLTPSEAISLLHLASGMTQKEIAKAINLSPRTVRGSLDRAYHRLGVTRGTAAVAMAQAKGWIRYAGKAALCALLAVSMLAGTDEGMRHRSPMRARTQTSASRLVGRRDTGSIYA